MSNLTRKIKYKGKSYKARDLYSAETGDVTVSVIALQSVLEKDKRSGSERVKADARERAMTIDHYLDTEEQLELPVEEVFKLIKEQGYGQD